MSVSVTGGATVTVALQGTVDGENWFDLNTDISSSSSSFRIVSTKHDSATGVQEDQRVCTAFRANLTSLSGGSDPTVSASIAIKE